MLKNEEKTKSVIFKCFLVCWGASQHFLRFFVLLPSVNLKMLRGSLKLKQLSPVFLSAFHYDRM